MENRPLADYAPNIILKAKDFAAEITIHNARTHTMTSEETISQEHVTNNSAVRDTLINRGITPEALPPSEDLKKVERRLASDARKSLKKPDSLDD
jgi:DNA-damage-inducible protein D